mmetsp:Transcript_23821/g.62373  ORF Transcript_23821/g.62373 Transcript_23821/m.62373 type:complete len:91 (-) Transcript_23821:91-363(-)
MTTIVMMLHPPTTAVYMRVKVGSVEVSQNVSSGTFRKVRRPRRLPRQDTQPFHRPTLEIGANTDVGATARTQTISDDSVTVTIAILLDVS